METQAVITPTVRRARPASTGRARPPLRAQARASSCVPRGDGLRVPRPHREERQHVARHPDRGHRGDQAGAPRRRSRRRRRHLPRPDAEPGPGDAPRSSRSSPTGAKIAFETRGDANTGRRGLGHRPGRPIGRLPVAHCRLGYAVVWSPSRAPASPSCLRRACSSGPCSFGGCGPRRDPADASPTSTRPSTRGGADEPVEAPTLA
jgi:hypothetical protein